VQKVICQNKQKQGHNQQQHIEIHAILFFSYRVNHKTVHIENNNEQNIRQEQVLKHVISKFWWGTPKPR
jgi:hypothetical protein